MPYVKKKPKARAFDKPTFPLSEINREYLYDRFQFTDPMVDEYLLREDVSGRLVIPLYNSNGVAQGLEIKRGRTSAGPKSLLYWGEESDGLGWFNTMPSYMQPYVKFLKSKEYFSDSIVLVEDVFSAMKANAFMDSIALCGVNLSAEQAGAIAAKNYRNVFVALDADATARGIKIVRTHRAIATNMWPIILSKDIKDMVWHDVASLLLTYVKRSRK